MQAQLDAEKRLRLNSEQAVRDLQLVLEESKVKEERTLKLLSNTQLELAAEKEKVRVLEGMKGVLNSVRRLLS